MSRASFAVLFALLLQVAAGQDLTGVISGVVSDPSGAVVPGAAVTIVNINTTARAWNGTTNAVGAYVAPSLPVGTYRITIEMKGFRKFDVEGLELQVSQRARVDAVLRTGEVTETITVSGESVAVIEAETSSLGLVINPNQVRDLPMASRNILNLLALSGGVSAGGDPTDIDYAQISINGSRTQSNEVSVDGVSVISGATGSIGHLPSTEAVREFKVQTSAYSSEYGRTGGGTVSLMVDSGTNRLRGGVYDYFRNEALNANNFFNNVRGVARPRNRPNQVGAKLGGPVWLPKLYNGKNRTFFFVNYQGTHATNPSSPISTIPDMKFRQGDFSSSPVPVADPLTHVAFPGNQIPRSRLDPAGQKIMGLLPTPNSSGSFSAATGQTVNNYVNNATTKYNDIDVTTRIDHSLSDRTRVYGKLTRFTQDSPIAETIPGTLNPAQNLTKNAQWNVALGYTNTLTPSLILDFRLGFMRATKLMLPPSYGTDVPSVLGIQRASMNVSPELNMTGWTDLGGIGNTWVRSAGNIFQYSPNITWVKGNQTIKAGMQLRKDQYNTFNPGTSFAGSYYFTGELASTNTTAGNAMNSLAELLLGAVKNATTIVPQPLVGRRASNLAFFVQDDWKLTRKLTLNIGLRHEYEAPLTTSNGMYSRVNVYTGKLLVANQNSSASLDLNPPKFNFSPRVGLAYMVDRKTVIRSAFGVFFGQLFSNLGGVVAYPGFTVTQTYGSLGRGIPQKFSLSEGMPLTPPAPFDPFQLEKNATMSNPLVPSTQFGEVDHLPENLQWNFGIQREIARGSVFEANYVGSHAYHLPLSLRWNALPSFQIAEQITATGTQVSLQQYRQFPTVQASNAVFNIGSSTYHSLQLRGNRQFSNSLSFVVSYTFAKAMDDGSGLFSNTQPSGAVDYGQLPQYARYLDHSVSALDRKHVLSVTPQYTTRTGPKWLRGIGINPVFTARTGFPMTVYQSSLYPDVLQQRPNINAPLSQLYMPQQTPNGTGIQYFRPVADPQFPLTPTGPLFATVNGKNTMILPAAIGNLGRYPVRTPGDINVNLAIGKRIQLTDRIAAQLRAEAYNALNHTNLALPSAGLAVVANGAAAGFNSPGFGLITAARNSRFMQLVARIEF